MTARKVNIIGPFPPPFGGISVHLKRIFDYINTENVQFYNTSINNFEQSKSLSKFDLVLFLFKFNQLIHYHSSSINIRLVLAICSIFNPSIYLHAHGASLTDQLASSTWKSKILSFFLGRMNIICSNTEIYNYINSNNSVRSLHLYDAFIPPLYDEHIYTTTLDKTELPKSRYLISMTGWFTLYNNQDLYGYDIMLQALFRLRKNNIDVSVVASVNGIENEALYQDFLIERSRLNLNENFYLIMDDLEELYPIILESDLFVRPTNTDGNAVSIKEALWFNTRVLASDSAPRPKEVITFENRQIDSLVLKIEEILRKSPQNRIKKTTFDKKFEHPMIKDIYGFKK